MGVPTGSRYGDTTPKKVISDTNLGLIRRGDIGTATKQIVTAMKRRGDIPNGVSSRDVWARLEGAVRASSLKTGRARQADRAKRKVSSEFGYAGEPFLGGSDAAPQIRMSEDARRANSKGDRMAAARLIVDDMAKTHGAPKELDRGQSARLVLDVLEADSAAAAAAYMASQTSNRLRTLLGDQGDAVATEIDRIWEPRNSAAL